LTGAFSQALRKNLPEAIGEHFGYAMVNRVARVGMWQKQDVTLRVWLHPSYVRLGANPAERCTAYRVLVEQAIPPDELDCIRLHLQRQHV
jgi:hypothetical protein